MEKTTALAAILTNEKGSILLQLRDSNTKLFPNTWSVFTGGMRQTDRNQEEGIRRVIGEEIHVRGKGLEPHDLKLFSDKYTYRDPHQHCIQFVYTGKLYVPEEERWLTLDDLTLKEGQAMDFRTPEEIRSMHLAANYGQILEAYLRQEGL